MGQSSDPNPRVMSPNDADELWFKGPCVADCSRRDKSEGRHDLRCEEARSRAIAIAQDARSYAAGLRDALAVVADLRELVRKATPGPVAVHRYDQGDGSINYQVQSEHQGKGRLFAPVLCHHSDRDSPRARADAELHVALRNAIEALVRKETKR